MMSEETIWVVTDDMQDSEARRDYRETDESRGVEVSVSALEQKMSHFLQSVARIFHKAEQQENQSSGMRLDEIELSVEVNGEGEVKLLGTGGKAGGKGAIKLKFKRL
jgi:hypothetical protein